LRTIFVIGIAALFLSTPVRAQALVDPSKVAPEHREAAGKRRAEQIRQRDCAKKADGDKVLPRDRTAYLNHCLEELSKQ
jgi:hypothetical protein